VAIREICKACEPVENLKPGNSLHIAFNIDETLRAGFILAASGGDRFKAADDSSLVQKSVKERVKLNEQLDINPVTKLNTKEWVSDEDLISSVGQSTCEESHVIDTCFAF